MNFVPLNVTSLFETMDQAVIQGLKKKCHHRLLLLLTITLFIDDDDDDDVRHIRKLT